MFMTDVTQADGTIVTYIHDKPNMEESTYVAYWTSNGIMASKDGGATFAIDANGNALLNTLMLKGLSADWIKVGTLEGVKAILESGLIGGWNITKGAIYKDVAMPNDENTIYRVYFQPPGGSAPDKTWILSCQKSTDKGVTFYGQFILYADGSASFGNGRIKINADGSASFGGANMTIGTDGSATFGGGKTFINSTGSVTFGDTVIGNDGSTYWYDGNDNLAMQIKKQSSGALHMSLGSGNTAYLDDLTIGKVGGNATYSGTITISGKTLAFLNGILYRVY